MNPVIQRELGEQARTSTLFRMRMAAAGVLLGTLAWGFFTARGPILVGGPFPTSGIPEGSMLLLRLHQALTLTLLAITPALTADAIARERRDATLGLLGLTPLRPLSVALGKAAANGLRALTLWLAPVPILTVPLLMGGVTAVELVTLVTFQLVLLAVGLMAGLAASTVALQFRRALALAYGFEGLLLLALFGVNQMLTSLAFGLTIDRWGFHRADELRWISNWPAQVFGGPYEWQFRGGPMAFVPNTGGPDWVIGLGLFVVAAIVVVALTLRFVAVRMTRAWHEEPPRPEVVALQRKLTTPVLFPRWLRERQRRRLTNNPLLWLQHRTVAAALTRWGWLAVLLGVWLVSLSDTGFFLGTRAAPLVLLGGMAFSAAGGFRAERESGTLELLLVTPLSPGQLMQSRAQAHLREFLVPVALQLFLVAYVSGQLTRDGLDLPHWNWWLVSSLVAMPWIGLWRGLRARNFVTAVLSTAFWSLLVPALVTMVLQAFYNPLFFETPARIGPAGFRFFLATRLDWGGWPVLFQCGIGGFAAFVVWRELTTRQFALAAVGRA